MKIMYILHESGASFNGASRSALTLIKKSLENNDTVYVVLPLKEGKIVEELKKLQYVKIIEEPYFRWKRVKPKKRIKRYIGNMKYHIQEAPRNIQIAKKLSRYAIAEKIDLIHTNSSVVNIGGLIHKYTKIPHIWHIREFGEEDFNMYAMNSNDFFYKFIYENSTKIVCISEAVAKKMRSHMPDKKIKVIYNGVEIPELRSKNQFSNNLLISGMISRKKGQWVAVSAIEILKQKKMDVNLYIAGKGNDADLGSDYINNSDRIKKLGFVENMEKLRAEMDIELMCSVSEGFGRTIIEGMAAGLLVIAAAGGAAPELIRDGENGFLFDVNDPKDLANVIQKVNALTFEEKMKIRERAYAEVKQKFSEEVYVHNIRNLYMQLLEKK